MTADETAVRALVDHLAAAWASGDADRYAAVFTHDADYVAFDGSHAKGQQEIADSHRPLFEGPLKHSRMLTGIVSVRFLDADIALVHSRGSIVRRGQTQPSKRGLSVQTLIAVKQEPGWRFTAFQNTRYRPWAETWTGKLLSLAAGLRPRT